MRQDQQVHVIGHDDPGRRLVKPLLTLTVANRLYYEPGTRVSLSHRVAWFWAGARSCAANA